ncbi:16S rRNA (cytosine(1402)-N(4))-methyltransferase [Candidatus Nomurabacteria bacterium CG_4_10_14_0_2_um_filter_30_12]|uniref:Ribosomal RNA small subunit methyltransferase H n=3 Tax=Candidatus Nomuraibacteriota TaxID=1752729 RepID=A0A2J0MGG1_9BACT|nr:MAG: 16S rRNA (cytosine(1402)-N(4))-methyltransferase [Candidatus Nomurabacteria bacterium CG10_big_fil_rev_8_21_14_0_10_03_31_7]PIZ87591.1 MAG: 16S rRNA (cytosine(1402)-N(4))-methyltransferase [Candidatus Nomurabacteria bacterium CG_4_10_14_0_2_um_filter_30_12]
MISEEIESIHKTVLLNETIEGLGLSRSQALGNSKSLASEKIVLDATFGGGGHSKEILERYTNIKIIALDQDGDTWKKAKYKFKGFEKRISFLNINFRDLKEDEKYDGIIFDLGLSSDQLENSGRGFSFIKKEPMLMTMKENPSSDDLTAIDIVNNWSEESLADIIYGYGEERFSRRIAKGIIEARKKNKIENTEDLVKIISDSVPGAYRKGRLHFATRTFQALRIAVNDELGALEEGLEKGFGLLKNRGRMSVISFHSLEDRIVKRFFRDKKEKSEAILINKKPIIATIEEIRNNPRSRSSKLRILEKI